ncbi:MAG: acyl-ACP--UDP-N-acetylglucosamine O-acyltransferase [Acidobacteria bacterium]|uniref:Acyl-[acyl-carrier-protein]--UDP-N-acetylglucosamine O-acyltransferase n=1 Tax=Candidatus Polarisedimenticola svalbardensis TaxID=2886004 RepID=A0A8J7CKE9_9BACT|nr:acyl-ACP--UDP-N-acetylglucosamine O-acyltransferase [Candidatus Polarisedimenticola svalbardensis]
MNPTSIHPTAIVDPGAELDEGVIIGPHAVIADRVRIGSGCSIGASTVIQGPTVLGSDNVIHPMTSIGGDPQDLKYAGEETTLTIGSRNRIREFVTINRGTAGGGGKTVVGDDNLLMAYAHFGHDCLVGHRTVFANAATLAGHVEVGNDATIGAYSGVHQFCRIADHAFIGGYSVVTRDAMPWVLTVGNRATSHGVNLVGLRRSGLPKETIRAIKQCYMTLFRSKLGLEEAVEQVREANGEIPEIRYFLEFVRSSERGVCR